MTGSNRGKSAGSGAVLGGLLVPGKPQILLDPDGNPGWRSLHDSMRKAGEALMENGTELLVLYSTQWTSIIGHQFLADPEPKWTRVDEDFHELGTIDYHLKMDAEFAESWRQKATDRGLTARTVAYEGFPVDTGSLVALKLLNPENRIPACVVSCNMYADRAETVILGKATRDAVEALGLKVTAVAVSALSNRMWTRFIDPVDDRIHSAKDDEWNRKILEILGEGRLEDVSQLAREFSSQAHGDNRFKAIWWLSALMGQDNAFQGRVLDYQAVWGTGAGVVDLVPARRGSSNLEYDEDDAQTWGGDRGVLSSNPGEAT